MLVGSAACTCGREQEVDERLGTLGVRGAGEHAGVLDLAEAGVEQRRVVEVVAPRATVKAGEES